MGSWRVNVLVLFVWYSGEKVADAQISMRHIETLYEAREQQLQQFSVELAITSEYHTSLEGPPPWPHETRTGIYRFAYSHGRMRLSGRWKDGAEEPEQNVEVDFDGSTATRVKDAGTVFFADMTSEAGACFPDGLFPLDFVVSLYGHPLSSVGDMLHIVSASSDADVLVLESDARESDGSSERTKVRVELDASHGYAIHRVQGLAQAVTGGDWAVNGEIEVRSWFPEQEGFWLPEEATYRHYSWANTDVSNGIRETGIVKASDVRFSSWKLNDVTLEELVIPDGTLVTNPVSDGQLRMRNVTDQDTADATAQVLEQPPRESEFMKNALLTVSVATLLLLISLWFYRRW